MGVLDDQIRKAQRRAANLDLEQLKRETRGQSPLEMASPEQRRERADFLAESLGDPLQAGLTFERIVAGNELQPVNYLEYGTIAAASVCRIVIYDRPGHRCGYATGFLIAPGVLITNHHVFPSAGFAAASIAQFDLELDVFGSDKIPSEHGFDPDRLFIADETLDFAVVAVRDGALGSGKPSAAYGFLPLIATTGKVMDGEWLTIVQHPGGEQKQLCVRENRLLTRTEDALWYTTDTLGGSSGAPVMNNDWQVVALHHKGIPEEKNGNIQTIDGRDYDPGRDSEADIKWVANEGIRISRIVDALRAARPDEPLLEPVFGMTPERARALRDSLAAAPRAAAAPSSPPSLSPSPSPSPARSKAMTMQRVTLTLDIAPDGRISLARPATASAEALYEAAAVVPARPARPRPPEFDIPFDTNYAGRVGYRPDFLKKGFEVNLPTMSPDLKALATRLLPPNGAEFVLKYHNYSVVLHKERRFAIFSAANIDGGNRFKLKRPTDHWRYDPRIPRAAQIDNFYYSSNRFDRGHLTRYEDLEFGSGVTAAVQSALDTCHWSNCTPQHEEFNQRQPLWQGLETHILEDSIRDDIFKAQVFTGPILSEGDPVWDQFPEIQYPVRFWKVAVAINSADKLFAAGFILDQSAVIGRFGIEAVGEIPFGAFKTFQVPIAEIEQLTGLTFTSGRAGKTSLSEADPLRAGGAARTRLARARRFEPNEAAVLLHDLPSTYVPLADEASIVR